jgi:hypothetical protein
VVAAAEIAPSHDDAAGGKIGAGDDLQSSSIKIVRLVDQAN